MAETNTTKSPAKKTAAASADKKPRAPRKTATKTASKAGEKSAENTSHVAEVFYEKEVITSVPQFEKPKIETGRYVFATGRRKTAIANVKMFSGSDDSIVNKKPLKKYFEQVSLADLAVRPLALTGLLHDVYFTAHVSGGGVNAQAEAVRHGVAQALASMNSDIRLVLKKNGFLTRDDRKKERKKPGLRGARRAPQWAKR